jgi:AAA domain (dynein-related subfamily)
MNLNLPEIDTEVALSLARFFIKAEKPLFFFGQKGVGKSSIAIEAASDLRFKINHLNLNVVDRYDFLGIPDIHNPSELVSYKSPYFLPPLKEGKKPDTVIILDEIDKCPQELTSPLYELLQRRTINGKPINVISFILTGNLPNEGTGSNDISTAILDRGAKYLLQFNLEKWLTWGRTHGVDSLILGFLQSNPAWACGKIEAEGYLASPSPRGWTQASDAMIKARSMKIVDTASVVNIVAGFVGLAAALQFQVWLEHNRNFEPAASSLIETGHCAIKYQNLTPTQKLIFVITACGASKRRFLKETKTIPQYIYVERLCQWLIENDVDMEICALAIANSFTIDLVVNPKYKLYDCHDFFALSSKASLPAK